MSRRTFPILAFLLALNPLSAEAQTEPLDVKVRACVGEPTSSTMAGCPNEQTVWTDPKPDTLVVAMLSGTVTTTWARFDALTANDRVSACLRTDVPAGAFQSCPTRVIGTTNWLAKSLVRVSDVLEPSPPAAASTCPVQWTQVTEFYPPFSAAIVTAYQLWKGPAPDALERHATVRSDVTEYTYAGLTPGVWHVAVTAIIDVEEPPVPPFEIEGEMSNILTCTFADVPKRLKAPILSPRVQ